MNRTELTDVALDELLRADAPHALADDGFVARTMAAVDQAERAAPARRRPAPVAPIVIARALAAEHRRHAAQARLWRWAIAGVGAGGLLLVLAMALSPDDGVWMAPPSAQQWLSLCTLLAVGALCIAWREFRRG